jgi:hypothetical protein
VKLVEFWFHTEQDFTTDRALARGTYAMSVDGRLSVHSFSQSAVNSVSFFANPLAAQVIANAHALLGITP